MKFTKTKQELVKRKKPRDQIELDRKEANERIAREYDEKNK